MTIEIFTNQRIMKYYKETTRYVAENKEKLREEYNSMKQSEFASIYGVSATHLFNIFGPKPIEEIKEPDKEKIFEMRKTMSDRKICTELNIQAHIFYKYIPRRFGENHTCRGKKKVLEVVYTPTFVSSKDLEHKPYWDVSTEVPAIGPIKGIRYNH